MTILLYIFAAIGAVVMIGGGIALAIDAAQTHEDMEYYLHTRFPELEKEIAAKLYEFELKLNNEGFVHKDQYDEDWNEFTYRLNTISDNVNEMSERLDVVADDNGGLWNKMDELQHELDRIEQNVQCIDITLKHVQRTYIPKPVYDPDDVRFPRTITGNSPYDITLTKITVGDDPEQMQNGTTVTSLEEQNGQIE